MNPDSTPRCSRCGGAQKSARPISRSPRVGQDHKIIIKLKEECDALYEDCLETNEKLSAVSRTSRETEEKLYAEQESSREKHRRITELEKQLSGVNEGICKHLSNGLEYLNDSVTPLTIETGLADVNNKFNLENGSKIDNKKEFSTKDKDLQGELFSTGSDVGKLDKESVRYDLDKTASSLNKVLEEGTLRNQVDNLTVELTEANMKIREMQTKIEQLEEDTVTELRNDSTTIARENAAGPSNICYKQIEQMTQKVIAENEKLNQQYQTALMLAGEWEKRFQFTERKRQRLQQIIKVLQQGSGLELHNEPVVLLPPEPVDLVQPRFQLQICNLEECKNCRRFLTEADFETELCMFHSCRPLSISAWQIGRLFPEAGQSQISMYKDYLFWPCCNKLARKSPEGCTVNRHEKLHILELN